MPTPRAFPAAFVAALPLALAACAAPPRAATRQEPGRVQAAAAAAEAGPAWSFEASALAYFTPDGHEYVQPTVAADRDWLHLEARYNYEALDAGSLWAGWNFAGGETLTWAITPMLGGVFGEATGIAPGYEGSLGFWRLEFYSEGEYMRDTSDVDDSFFYSWSELTVAPWDWLRLGVVGQRTRAYSSDLDVQRGLLAGITTGQFDFTVHVFNLDESKPAVVLAAALRF